MAESCDDKVGTATRINDVVFASRRDIIVTTIREDNVSSWTCPNIIVPSTRIDPVIVLVRIGIGGRILHAVRICKYTIQVCRYATFHGSRSGVDRVRTPTGINSIAPTQSKNNVITGIAIDEIITDIAINRVGVLWPCR